MLKSVTYAVTKKCNSRCTNCNIWKTPSKEDNELTVEQAVKLFSLKEFADLNNLGITGGEPFLRSDINDLLSAILKANRSINTIHINTNASKPEKVLSACELISSMDINAYIGVSIDGDKNTNKLIRGVDNYHDAVNLIRSIRRTYRKINASISFTVCKLNCDIGNLSHIKDLAEVLECDYSFRVASLSKSFYMNEGMDISLTQLQKKTLIQFIIENKLCDEFMQEQLYYLATGKVPILFDYHENQIICPAGNLFAFINSNGDIHPCFLSDEVIGDYKNGLYRSDFSFKKTRHCPCMTECNIIAAMLGTKQYKSQMLSKIRKQIEQNRKNS